MANQKVESLVWMTDFELGSKMVSEKVCPMGFAKVCSMDDAKEFE